MTFCQECIAAISGSLVLLQIITISGRTIRKEAQASPDYAENAIIRINDLLDLIPQQKIDEAQELRKARRPKSLVKREDVPLNAVAA